MEREHSQQEEETRLSLEQSIGMLNAQAGDALNLEVKRRAGEIIDTLSGAEAEQRTELLRELEKELGKYDSTDPTDIENKRNALRWVREMQGE